MQTPAAPFQNFKLLLSFTLAILAFASQAEEIEVNSKDQVPVDLIEGPNHKVADAALSNGIQTTYLIETSYGEFTATGINELRVRIVEIDALAYLETLSKTNVFVESLADAGVTSITTIAEAFTKPVTSVKGLPGGIQKLFSGTVEGAKRGIGLTGRFFKSKADDLDPADFRERNYLVGDAQRQWSEELKVDPYTTNIKLRDTIGDMSVVQFVGGLPVDIALPLGASLAVGILDNEERLYELSAAEVETLNRSCLAELEAAESDIEAFIEAPYLTPTTQTLACESLTSLSDVDGSANLLDGLTKSASFEEANFQLNALELLAWYHTSETPLASISTGNGIPYGIPYGEDKSGELIVMLPSDRLQWTETVQAIFTTLQTYDAESRSVWVLGQTTDATSSALASAGWQVHSVENNSALEGLYLGDQAAEEASDTM